MGLAFPAHGRQMGCYSVGRWNKDSPWQKVVAQLLTVLLVVNWENVSEESNVVKGKAIQT